MPELLPIPDPRLPPTERDFLKSLVRRAFLLRLALVVGLAWTGFSARLAPDEATYSSTGQAIAAYWNGDTLVQPWRLSSGQPLGYFYLNAASLFLFGSVLPLRIANALLGALVCWYAYLLARSLFGIQVARRTAYFSAYLPSLVLWSAVNIRDVWVIFLIVFVSWKSVSLILGYSHLGLALVVASIAALAQFREYLFFVVAAPPVVALLIGRRGHLGRNFVLASLAALAVLVMVQQGEATRASNLMNLEVLAEKRKGMFWGAGSAFAENVDISTPGGALRFLPIGLAYFFFSPFPWQITSFLKLISLPEMLLLYALTPAIVRGIRYAVAHRFRASLQVLLLTALVTVSYALGSGNVGTLYRHRAQAIVFYLMFAAVGLELRVKRRQGRTAVRR